jgi:predicted Na+-dependent transporter
MDAPIPQGWLGASVAITLFTVIFSVGFSIPSGGLRWIWRRPGPMARGLFSVLVVAPAIA